MLVDYDWFANPVTDYTRIKFENKVNESFDVNIYTIKGKLVNTYYAITNNEIMFERNSLENGLYIIQLLKENKIVGKEMMILK